VACPQGAVYNKRYYVTRINLIKVKSVRDIDLSRRRLIYHLWQYSQGITPNEGVKVKRRDPLGR